MQVSSRYCIEWRARRLELLAIFLEPLDSPDAAEVHNVRRPPGRQAPLEPLPDRLTNQSVTRFATLSGGLVEPFNHLILEVDAEIHDRKFNRLGYVRKITLTAPVPSVG